MWYTILVITGHYLSIVSILPEVYAPKVMTAMVALVSKYCEGTHFKVLQECEYSTEDCCYHVTMSSLLRVVIL